MNTPHVFAAVPNDCDWRVVSRVIRRVLSAASVLRVKDGEQAIRFAMQRGLLSREPQLPDLIIIDMALPVVPACEFIERLQEHVHMRAARVIALTDDHAVALTACARIGIHAIAVKSSAIPEFEASLARVLGCETGDR